MVAKEPSYDETMTVTKNHAKAVLISVQDNLIDAETPNDISMTDLLIKAGASENDYMDAISISQKR